MKVNICGIPHEIKYVTDNFQNDLHLGQIDYGTAIININNEAAPKIQEETLCHEIMHGILTHIGRQDLSCDETLVQALGNAVNPTFDIRFED